MERIDKYLVDMDCYYDPENHFWIRKEDNRVTLGLSPLVQETNGSFVALAFDPVKDIEKGQSMGNIEAEKHVGPLLSPLSGMISEINEKVIENPRLINEDPYGEGWIVKMYPNNFAIEAKHLVSGKEEITKWFNSELSKFDEKGWIAR